MLPFKSLDAAATVGAGAQRDLETVAKDHTAVIVDTGADHSVAVSAILEGSLDGATWVLLANLALGAGNPGPVVGTATAGHWVRFVRVNGITVPSGRVLTAWIATHADEED